MGFEVKIELKPSAVCEGIGCFAKETIPKNTIIWKYVNEDVEEYTTEEYKKLLKDTLVEDKRKVFYCRYSFFCTYIQKYVTILEPGMFVNHSFTPNSLCVEKDSIAIRDIQIGEEILEDYTKYLGSLDEEFQEIYKKYIPKDWEFMKQFCIKKSF
jgi:SET domain-containing protein